MGDSLRRVFLPHATLFAGDTRFDGAAAAAAKTVRDFDDAITRRSFGFPDVDAYYRASGSSQRLAAVALPLLCVQAADDPIAVDAAVPRDIAAANPNVALIVTPSGGHLGWLASAGDGMSSAGGGATGAPWPYEGVLQWFAAVAAEAVEEKQAGAAAAGGRQMAAAGRK
jgi:hypothetical protein